MSLISKIYKKAFCVMQWNIGFVKADIKNIIRQKNNKLHIHWFPLNNSEVSIADPFIFKNSDNQVSVLYEDFSMVTKVMKGTIKLAKLNEHFDIVLQKELLNTEAHLSYPFIVYEEDKMYVIPESRQSGELAAYEYDVASDSLINKKVIIDNLPLLDATFLKYNNKYWIFATMGDHLYEHSKLYIYYADSLFGQYHPHPQNPGQYRLKGARPGGAFIEVDGELYRPAQNCEVYYGKSLVIHKLVKLTETEFEESIHMELTQQRDSAFNGGLHTINAIDDLIVIDGIRLLFAPITKVKLFLNKMFN